MRFAGLAVIFLGLFILYLSAGVGVDTGVSGVRNVAHIPGVIIGVGLLIVGAIFAAAGEVIGSQSNRVSVSEKVDDEKEKLPETLESKSREIVRKDDGSISYRGQTAKKIGRFYHYNGMTFIAEDRLIQEIDSMF